MFPRKGLTLIELLVVMFLGGLILMVSLSFFTKNYKMIVRSSKEIDGAISSLNTIDLIISDLKKAGYGITDKKSYPPIFWDEENKTLTIKYVNYDKSDCEGVSFTSGDNCSYEIKYVFQNNNIKRTVDEGSDGSGTSAYLFDSKKLVVKDFTVNYDNKTKTVTFTLVVENKMSGKESNFIDSVECLNCE